MEKIKTTCICGRCGVCNINIKPKREIMFKKGEIVKLHCVEDVTNKRRESGWAHYKITKAISHIVLNCQVCGHYIWKEKHEYDVKKYMVPKVGILIKKERESIIALDKEAVGIKYLWHKDKNKIGKKL